jgi:formiminotetrahydrofolate cyclodeaminase
MDDSTRSVAETTVADFGQALASEQPTPGGGAAAALAAMLAASLTSMVVRLSLDRPRYAEHASLHDEALVASDDARRRFLELADLDAEAYAGYRQARRMPHDTPAQEEAREAATRAAARRAAEVPLELVRACHAQVDLVERLAGRSNLGVASDLEVAALLLDSAARAAGANVTVNLDAIGDPAYGSAVSAELVQRLQQVQATSDRARERVAKGSLRQPEVG